MVSLMDMNSRYEQLCQWLQDVASSDPVRFSADFSGSFPDLADAVLKPQDAQDTWAALTSDASDLDEDLLGQALQVAATHMLVLARRR